MTKQQTGQARIIDQIRLAGRKVKSLSSWLENRVGKMSGLSERSKQVQVETVHFK